MANADVFLEKYKQLEEVVRSTYRLKDNDSISYYLSGQVKYQRYRDDIKYCQDVRNVLSHKKKVKDQYAVEPSQEMIVFLEKLIEKVKNRTRCHEIQIGVQDVFWQPMTGNVKAAMLYMRAKMYTHIPIMEDGSVIGVFDENSVFNYLADEGIIEISDELTFERIKPYLSLEGREMEEFIFFPPTGYVEELENEFEKAYRKGKRIGVAFITPTGKKSEKLQGIITPWDILASKK